MTNIRDHLGADNPKDTAGVRRRLLRWYDREQRDMPWRQTSDPYHIWVSEIMLQQTRVEAVIPYYKRFLRQFPSVAHLARASNERVLTSWSGLGYYSRARNLHRAAKQVQSDHGGVFPREEQAALDLPGVGRYTAAAILSIAYGVPLAVLDGNVARVLSRLCTVRAVANNTAGRKTLWRLAQEILDTRRPGDFNQAMMELGATICLPGQPRCGSCPLRKDCRAHLQDVTGEYPPARVRAREKSLKLVAAVVRDRAGKYLLERRPAGSSWLAGFLEFPMWPATAQISENGHAGSSSKARLKLVRSLGTIRHSITQFRIEVELWQGAVINNKQADFETKSRKWVDLAAIKKLPITTISRKALAMIGEQREE